MKVLNIITRLLTFLKIIFPNIFIKNFDNEEDIVAKIQVMFAALCTTVDDISVAFLLLTFRI